jgi:hypothetical protein
MLWAVGDYVLDRVGGGEGCATGEAGTTRGAREDDGPPHADADDILLYR